jgi:hypothetical protein
MKPFPSPPLCLLMAAITITGCATATTAGAQSLEDAETIPSWWAAPDDPPMIKTEGTLRHPDGVKVHFANRSQPLEGWEAIVFLLTRDYIEYTVVDRQLRLKTTRKYKDWKKTVLPPGGGGGGGASGSGSGTTANFSLSGGFDPDHVRAFVAKVAASGAMVEMTGSDITFEFVPNGVGGTTGRLVMNPPSVTYTWKFTYATGMVDIQHSTCSLRQGHYNILSPDNPLAMVGGWGATLNCHTIGTRDGKETSNDQSDRHVMINYDPKKMGWILTIGGLQDGVWKLQ